MPKISRIQALFGLVALTVVLGITAAQPVSGDAVFLCSDHALDVTLAPGATDTYQVVGTLCSRGPADGKTVQVLLHGSTYARYYWDFPYQREHYSYVRAATDRGYVTFNLDRIGNGESDRPDGSLVGLDANAFVVHQVVAALHAGEVASLSFDKVIVVGHSMGSFTTLEYAATFPGEADGIILTGFLHDANFDFVYSVFFPALYPAAFDPKFAGQLSDFNYLTTLPGSRGGVFYYEPTVDPVVLAVDEGLKQTTTVAELTDAVPLIFDPISLQVEGPVQVVLGEFDGLFCGSLVNCSDPAMVQSYEEGWYSTSACVETAVIRAAGHCLNLQTNAVAAYAQMLSWADRHVGATAGPPPQPCGTP